MGGARYFWTRKESVPGYQEVGGIVSYCYCPGLAPLLNTPPHHCLTILNACIAYYIIIITIHYFIVSMNIIYAFYHDACKSQKPILKK